MHHEAKTVYLFMRELVKNPNERACRRLFADWLEANDEPELAEEVREECPDHTGMLPRDCSC